MSIPIGSTGNPVHVTLGTVKTPTVKEMIGITLVTILPIAIAILMQKPGLRQSITMRACHFGREVCHKQADLWNKIGDVFAQEYNKARM